jgi:hypothetical protein
MFKLGRAQTFNKEPPQKNTGWESFPAGKIILRDKSEEPGQWPNKNPLKRLLNCATR